MNEPTHIDLFSGIGGFALAAQRAGFRTVAFCEIDKYCQRVLAKNFSAVLADTVCERRQQIAGSAHGDEAENERRAAKNGNEFASGSEDVADAGHGTKHIGPRASSREGRQWTSERQGLGSCRPAIISDIFDFDGTQYKGCSLLTGGFPCQPFSVAGKRRGKEDDRHLWPEMLRVIAQARPAWVLGENVPGIIPMELDNVLSDLEAIGYATRPFTIPACAVDARHRRDRVWIIANTESTRLERFGANAGQPEIAESRNGSALANTKEQRNSSVSDDENSQQHCQSQGEFGRGSMGTERQASHWLSEPDVGRVAHGVPSRVDRLKGLGNAIVPQVACEILKEIRLTIPNG